MALEGTFRSQILFAFGTIESNSAFVIHVLNKCTFSFEGSLTLVALERQNLSVIQSYLFIRDLIRWFLRFLRKHLITGFVLIQFLLINLMNCFKMPLKIMVPFELSIAESTPKAGLYAAFVL